MALRMMDDTTPLPREYYKLVQKSSIDIKSLSTTRPTSFLYQGLWIGNDRCCYLKLMICQLTWSLYCPVTFLDLSTWFMYVTTCLRTDMHRPQGAHISTPRLFTFSMPKLIHILIVRLCDFAAWSIDGRIYANFDFFLTETNILSRCMNLMMITFNKRYKSLRSRQVALWVFHVELCWYWYYMCWHVCLFELWAW